MSYYPRTIKDFLDLEMFRYITVYSWIMMNYERTVFTSGRGTL